MTMIFATFARQEQLPNAIVLAESIKRYHPEAYTVLGLVGHQSAFSQPASFDEVLLTNPKPEEEESVSPAAYKVYFLKHLLGLYFPDRLIYLDPECKLFGPVHELFQMLLHHDIISAPYYLEPQEDSSREIELLRNGFLHAGLLALRPTENAMKFMQWWLRRICKKPTPHSEHKWLSLGMTPYRICLLKHEAYHLSVWNFHEKRRRLRLVNDQYFVEGFPLRTAYMGNPDGTLETLLSQSKGEPINRFYNDYWNKCAAVKS